MEWKGEEGEEEEEEGDQSREVEVDALDGGAARASVAIERASRGDSDR